MSCLRVVTWFSLGVVVNLHSIIVFYARSHFHVLTSCLHYLRRGVKRCLICFNCDNIRFCNVSELSAYDRAFHLDFSVQEMPCQEFE